MGEGKQQFSFVYDMLFDDVSKRKVRRAAFMDDLDRALEKTVNQFFEPKECGIDEKGDEKYYHCDEGTICLTNYEGKLPQLILLKDRGRGQDTFSSGRVLACLLRVLQVHDIIPSNVWYCHKGKEYRISNLMSVNVHGVRGKTHECINKYAIPGNHLNGRIVKSSAQAIAGLERQVLKRLEDAEGKEITIVTSAMRVWDRKHGSYEPFFTECPKAYVLRRQVINVGSDVPRTEPNPRSGGAQSP